MLNINVSLSVVDPFAPEMTVVSRRILIPGRAGFVMDLAWCARVLFTNETREREEALEREALEREASK
jgi:hypothetical protein